MELLIVKHWKRNLFIPLIFFSLLFVFLVSLGPLGMIGVVIVYAYPWLFYIPLGIAAIVFIAGLIGGAIAGSRRFTFIRFAVGVLMVLILILFLMLSRLLFRL